MSKNLKRAKIIIVTGVALALAACVHLSQNDDAQDSSHSNYTAKKDADKKVANNDNIKTKDHNASYAEQSPEDIVHEKYAKGHFKVGARYVIKGKAFTPSVDLKYDEVGYASWYGPGFHGKDTANGTRYDQEQYIAAHRELPMPSIVKVTNLENGKSLEVVILDRGPFNHTKGKTKRIIDLSKRAAQDLGFLNDGVAKVRVEYLHTKTESLIAMYPESQQKRAKKAFQVAIANFSSQDSCDHSG